MAWLSPRSACGLAAAAVALAAGAGILLAVAGPGHRWGWWGARVALAALKWTLLAALVAALLGVIALVAGALGGGRAAVLGGAAAIAIAVATLWLPLGMFRVARTVPRIHDITTDPTHPPAFVAVGKLRKQTDHSIEYEGSEIFSEQREAYPDIQPLIVKAPKDKVFEASRQALASMGLDIVDANPGEGRIEAVDTTLLYGFKDDVAVRVQETADGTRVDIRSMSRVGKSDLGVNAKRIRTFMARLRAGLPA